MSGRTSTQEREASVPVDPALKAALQVLADPVRLRILALLRQSEQCVCHLVEELGLSQGTVSYHVAFFRRAGLIRERRDPEDSRWVYYSLQAPAVARLLDRLRELLDVSTMDPTPASCRDRCSCQ